MNTNLRHLFDSPDETERSRIAETSDEDPRPEREADETETAEPLRAVLSSNLAHYYDTDTGETICQYELERPFNEYPTLSIEALDPQRQICSKCDAIYRDVPSRLDAIEDIIEIVGLEGERKHLTRDDLVAIRDELVRLRAIEEGDL